MITAYDVHRWLLEAVRARSRVSLDSRVIHVTEVTQCLRRSYFLRTRLVQLSPANALRLIGDEVHKALQEVLKRYGYEVEFRVAIDAGDVKLVGHVDAYHPKGKYIIEFKTVAKIPKSPYPNHLMQTQAYIALTYSRTGFIAYIARDNGDVKVFKVRPNKQTLRKLILRARELSKALTKGGPPRPEKSPLCNQCEFKYLCLKA